MHGNKTDLNAILSSSAKHTVISLFVNVFKIHEIRHFYLLSLAYLLNACSVISCNWYDSKMNVFGFAFETARVRNAHAVQGLWPNCWPVRRVPTIHATVKNYRKYRKHGTSLNKNKQWEISLVFSFIIIKGEIIDKKFWFESTISFRLLQLIAQSIFLRFQANMSQNLS